MIKLRKVLSDSERAGRRRRNNLNLQITFLSWLVEFFGFFIMFMVSFLVGHGNILVIQVFETIASLFYLAIVPSMYLVNGSDFKDFVVDSSIYLSFDRMFTCKVADIEEENVDPEPADQNESNKKNKEIDDQSHEENAQIEQENQNPGPADQNESNKMNKEINDQDHEENAQIEQENENPEAADKNEINKKNK